jgi:hypothetical protein
MGHFFHYKKVGSGHPAIGQPFSLKKSQLRARGDPAGDQYGSH